MPIVARPRPRRQATAGVALTLLAVVVGACAAPVAPSGSGGSPPASGVAAGSPPPCAAPAPVPPPGDVPWWRDAVFYEVFVRSFADSDDDGVGDLAGLTAHLDYLNDGDPTTSGDLGITALWLMPIAEAASYHGYDVIDYTAIERDYGNSDAFKTLLAEAHRRGIKVIVDFVINHTSSQHPWFVDAQAGGPHHDWYVWSATDPGWPGPTGGNPWHRAGDAYYYGVFSESMPDLNLRNQAVTAEIDRIASFWLDDLGVDGFRIDAARHLIEDGPDAQVNTPETHAWLQSFRSTVHAGHPAALVVGEVWDARAISSAYARDGSLDMPFDFGIGPTIESSVTLGDAPSLLAGEDEVGQRYEPAAAGTFLSNHDQPRIMTDLHGDVAAAGQAAAALLTGPGVPFLYYGEEIGLAGSKPDEQIRTPFPWTAATPGHGFSAAAPWEPFTAGADRVNVEAEASDPASLLSTYRDLIHLRDGHPSLSRGTFTRVQSSVRTVAASLRSYGDETMLVLQNLTTVAVPNVSLDLEAGPLCGSPTATVVFPAGAPTAPVPQVSAPTVTAAGGFAGYQPLAVLPGRSTTVIRLIP